MAIDARFHSWYVPLVASSSCWKTSHNGRQWCAAACCALHGLPTCLLAHAKQAVCNGSVLRGTAVDLVLILQLTPSEESALDAEHARCLSAAAAVFDDIAVGDPSIRAAHQHKYIQACKSR